MKRLALLAFAVAVAFSPVASVRALRAAELKPANAAPFELPPMLVEESKSNVPWLYVQAGNTEFLSRCSAGVTRELAEAWLGKTQLIRVLVPEEFLGKLDVPSVFVLYAQDAEQTVSREIERELPRAQAGEAGYRVATSMRIADRDMNASIAYIDEALFDGAGLSISPGHVRYLLQNRVPELPAWLVDGIVRMWRRADFILDPVTLQPLVWFTEAESEELAGDALRPRALLPANELFASDESASAENQHPRYADVRAATQELFVRWALTTGGATRDALWKFAARAAEKSVTEADFEAAFGFDYAELRDRLSDYLTTAVTETKQFETGTQPPLPPVEVERATPEQVARIRGEWERLAAHHVQKRLPQAREPYLAQARRTLRHAYELGDRDPRLLATMGLLEIDAGNEADARGFLEAAVAANVIRPRAYYELARLRFSALTRGAPEPKRFSYTDLAPVLQPLQHGLTQSPPLPEVFALLGEVWARCETTPNTAEFAELKDGARLFNRRPTVAYPLALALARHGKPSDAAAVLDAAAAYSADEATLAGIARLRSEIEPVVARATAAP